MGLMGLTNPDKDIYVSNFPSFSAFYLLYFLHTYVCIILKFTNILQHISTHDHIWHNHYHFQAQSLQSPCHTIKSAHHAITIPYTFGLVRQLLHRFPITLQHLSIQMTCTCSVPAFLEWFLAPSQGTLFFLTPYTLSFTEIMHIVTPTVQFPPLNVTDPSFFSIEALIFQQTSFYCQRHCQPLDLSHNKSSLLLPTVNTSLSSFLQLPWLFIIQRESNTCLLPPNIPPRPVKPPALGTTAFNFNQLRRLLKS